MKDPVTAKDGYTYERSFIEKYIKDFRGKSPMNREKIEIKSLFPNKALKKAIVAGKYVES